MSKTPPDDAIHFRAALFSPPPTEIADNGYDERERAKSALAAHARFHLRGSVEIGRSALGGAVFKVNFGYRAPSQGARPFANGRPGRGRPPSVRSQKPEIVDGDGVGTHPVDIRQEDAVGTDGNQRVVAEVGDGHVGKT